MATACFSQSYFEQPRDVLEAEYELFPGFSDPRIEGIKQHMMKTGQVDYSNSDWSLQLDRDARRKLRWIQAAEGGACEPPVRRHSKHKVPVPETHPKLESIEAEDTWDGWNDESNRVKEFEKHLSSIIRKDTPREERDIEEDNHTADWATRMEEPRFVRVYRRGHSGVKAAEAATDFVKKVKIEDDTEGGLLEDDRAEVIEDGKEINPSFSQYL